MKLGSLRFFASAVLIAACGDDGGSTGTGSATSGSTSSTSSTETTSESSTESSTSASSSTTEATSTTDETSGTTGTSGSTTGDTEMPVGASGAYRFTSPLSFTVYDMAAHPDGGVIIVGNVLRDPEGTPSREAAIAHIDDEGELVWARRTEWAGNEQFFAVLLDGPTIFGVGLSRRDSGMGNNDEILLSRFALDGTYNGSLVFGDPLTDEHGWDAIVATDGGMLIAGFTTQSGFGDRDAALYRLDATLQPDWAIAMGGGQRDVFRRVVEDADGGFIGVGSRGQSPTTSDSLIAKVDADGDLVYNYNFGDGSEADAMRGVAALGQGRYLVVGETGSSGAGSLDGYFGVFEPGGASLFELSTVGGAGYDVFGGLVPLGGGRFITVGQIASVSMTDDPWIGRIDTNDGVVLDWHVAYEADAQQRTFGGGGAVRTDGGLAIALHDVEGMNDDIFEPGVVYTDSLGGFDGTCPVATADAYDPQAFDPGPLETAISQAAVTFVRTDIAVMDEPVVTLNMGMSTTLCQ